MAAFVQSRQDEDTPLLWLTLTPNLVIFQHQQFTGQFSLSISIFLSPILSSWVFFHTFPLIGCFLIRNGAEGKENHLNNFSVRMPFCNKLIIPCTQGEIYTYILPPGYMNRRQLPDFMDRTKPSKEGRENVLYPHLIHELMRMEWVNEFYFHTKTSWFDI